jgi:hypothetical protein
VDSVEFAKGLRGSKDWREDLKRLEEVIADEPRVALELSAALAGEFVERGPDLALESVWRSLLDITSGLPQEHATLVSVRLAARPPISRAAEPTHHGRSRDAMQIVGTRPADGIRELLRSDRVLREEDPEFGLHLVHELVIRGEDVSSVAKHFIDWGLHIGHPLSSIPARLSSVELGLAAWLPRFRPHAWATPIPEPIRGSQDLVPVRTLVTGIGPLISRGGEGMYVPFTEWIDKSNGRVTVATFRLGESFPPSEGIVDGPKLTGDLLGRSIEGAAACERLFSAAVGGGAYSHGPGGAYSRLWMWEGVAALLDHPWPSSVDMLDDAVRRARWVEIASSDEWFNNVAWDVWLLVEVGSRVVVLAATDTD